MTPPRMAGHRKLPRPWILATALVAACLLPTEGGAGFGEMRVRPVFEAGVEPGSIGAGIDSIRTVVRRPGGNGGPIIDQIRPYAGHPSALTWLIELHASSEEMDVELELRTGTSTRYRGGRAIVVRNGSLGNETIDDIPVAYVGPALASRIEISPSSAAFTRLGASRQLEGVAYAAGDAILTGLPLSWSSANQDVVTVTESGEITSTGFGATYVVAAADGVADTVSVLVDATLLDYTIITATPTAIPANGAATALITVHVRDENDDAIGASAGVVVLATDLGDLGAVTDHGDGTYTATLTAGTTTGTATVTGTLDGSDVDDSAQVQLTPPGEPPAGTYAEITADPTAIEADGESTSSITVRLFEAGGEPLGHSAGVVALALAPGDPGSLGAVTDHGDGTYTATLTGGTTTGTATVTGTLNGDDIGDSAQVQLTPGAPDPTTTRITAAPTAIPANGSSTSVITVEVRDAHGNPTGQSAGSVQLALTPVDLGDLGAVTDHGDGTYTATLTAGTTTGTATVTGTLDGSDVDDSAQVQLTTEPGDWIEEATVTVDEGENAANSGAFGDLGGEGVTFTASIGTVVGNGGGAWSWSFATTDGPAESQVVTIGGDDGLGAQRAVTFDLIVHNVAPIVDAGPGGTVVSGGVFEFFGGFSDPGIADSPWNWVIDWGDGASSAGSTATQTGMIARAHQFCAAGERTVTLSVTDKDGDTGWDEAMLTVVSAAIQIMIQPSDSPNSVSLRRQGVLPVAVLSSDDFDATQMVPATITLGNEVGSDTPVAQRPNGTLFASVEDVDGDGRPDLVLHFRVPALVENGDLTPASTHLVLRGSGQDGCASFRGVDSVRPR